MDERGAMKIAEEIVRAENTAGPAGRLAAERVVSLRFTWITRAGKPASGDQEQTREELLAAIEAAAPNTPYRSLEFDQHPSAWPLGSGCWVVRGIVATRNKAAPERDGLFRNTWILRRDEDREWRLFTLQVTPLHAATR